MSENSFPGEVLSYLHIFLFTIGANLPNRWNFIQGDHANSSSKSKSKSAKVYRWTMQKRLQHHKKKLMDLEQAQKTF
jgi:hypothetical protein